MKSSLLRIVVLSSVILSSSVAAAANYYVASNGVDGPGRGTLANPFKTINYAANQSTLTAGDTVYIRGGTYRETVNVGRSGNASHPITFMPYGGEHVTVTGLDVVNSTWSVDTGSVYKTTVPGGMSQLFVGGQMMTEARWPNAGYNNPLHAATATVESSTYAASPGLSTITDSALASTGSWVGAKVVANRSYPGWTGYNWTNLSRTIESQSGNTLNYYADRDEANSSELQNTTGRPYYIIGSRNALNAPREYYYDGSSQLYLQAPDNVNPGTLTVEARKRQNGFDLGTQSYVQLKGLSLKAATIKMDDGSHHNLVDNCQILYPTPYTEPVHWQTTSPSGVQLYGQNNTIQNSEIGYSWGNGISMTGAATNTNTVINNVIHDVGWAGNATGFVSIENMDGPAYTTNHSCNTITNNTMYNSGDAGVILNHLRNVAAYYYTTVEHNDISRYCRLSSDIGGVYMFAGMAEGSSIAYNRIDSAADWSPMNAGVYMDDATGGTTIHHNLLTKGKFGVIVKGANQKVYNNTIWDAGNGSGKAVLVQNTYGDIYTANNLANLPQFDSNPQDSSHAYNNVYQTANQFNNSAAGDYTLKANGSGMYAVDAGAPITDITPAGDATPDVGAFQSGQTPWTAGASFKTWSFGNQCVAPLLSAVTVTASNVRDTTGSLAAGRLSTTSSSRCRAFFRFDLTKIPDVKITNAVLRLYENTAPASADGGVSLYQVLSSWTDSTVSFSQSVSSSGTSFYDPANLDFYTDVDITAIVQAWLDNPSTNFGLSLRGSESTYYTAKCFDGYYGITAPQLLIALPEPSMLTLLSILGIALLALRLMRCSP
jgi:hypothetical protein